MIAVVVLLVALVLFLLASFGVASRLHFGWLGLAVLTVYLMVGPVSALTT